MSDNKKYYYLKLVDNFYERDEMIMLESMPEGYMYSNILLKLYLRSLKNEGKLMFNNKIPYNAIMLANVTRFPVAVVEKAINIFKELGLIEILDNGAIYMLDIQNFIGKSSTEADRKRLYRNRIEEEKKSLGQMSDKTPLEIEKETDKEIEQQHIDKIVVDNERERSLVVFELKKAYNYLLDKDIKKISDTLLLAKQSYDLPYLKEKIELSKKQSNIRNLVGFLIKAINEDFSNERITNFDKNNSDKTLNHKVHNFSGSDAYSKYSEEELEQIILENQKHKFQ
ncbi:phage replisome organizer N-terminal domain-containing protein [Paraclostridium ghonii]|uniref:phage replisome organizer N-terminal domain-containing protein n=1 Tax=Paraclostridium ghonii TaxID=29358 RepID=UPI00202CCF02|nr:phage replisome organizer N-terminal domain-containing protein [Paeniclostridium ghonii]MCM0165642.1 phage replisome organizer N-terminal domain-containing protein [Paeniclostridium ghonii]